MSSEGEAVNEDRFARAARGLRDELERDRATRASYESSGHEALTGAERDLNRLRDRTRAASGSKSASTEQTREAERERDEAVKAINDLKELQILSETQYRELQDIVPPGVFRAAMGAEAVYDYVSNRIDLDQLARPAPRGDAGRRPTSSARRRPSACAWSRRCARAATGRTG